MSFPDRQNKDAGYEYSVALYNAAAAPTHGTLQEARKRSLCNKASHLVRLSWLGVQGGRGS